MATRSISVTSAFSVRYACANAVWSIYYVSIAKGGSVDSGVS